MNLILPCRLVFMILLILLILCVSNLKKSNITNYIENFNNYANLDGNWIIQSITPEKTKKRTKDERLRKKRCWQVKKSGVLYIPS